MIATKQPKTKMQHYKVLANNAGVRVSPICLGAMNFGDAMKDMLGECTKDEAFKIMDAFYHAGGNFIDTANNYQFGQSEQWVGEWMKARGNRDEMVIATKFTTTYVMAADQKITINYTGNHSKSLHCSVRDSLKKLGTDYIDILYVHWWDYTTSIPELMESLNHLVAAGKVLYLGASDTPAWVVSAANTYARDHNLSPFVIYQGKWNIAEPEFERDIIPMARAFGMALAPWSVMLGGKSKTPDQGKGRTDFFPPSERKNQTIATVLNAIDVVAKELGATRQQICIAYVLKKEPQTFPILGGRKVNHLIDNLKALDVLEKLTDKHIEVLEKAANFDIGFPHDFVGTGQFSKNPILAWGGKIQELEHPIYQG